MNGTKHKVQVDYHQMFFAPFNVHPVMTRDQDARLLNITTDRSSLSLQVHPAFIASGFWPAAAPSTTTNLWTTQARITK